MVLRESRLHRSMSSESNDSKGEVEHRPLYPGYVTPTDPNQPAAEVGIKESEEEPRRALRRRSLQVAPDYMHSCLHFAVDLLESLRRNSGATGNVLFSPFVLSSTLMALYNGARGRTADQIARAMHLGLDSCSVASSLPLWYAGLFPSWPDSHKRKFEISHDQCLVHDKSIRIAHGYKHWLSQWCRVEHEDFANDPTDGVVFPTRMTTWIGALTSFSCKAAEEPAFWSEVDRTTSLFLLSLLFIKGKWRDQFHVTRGVFHETHKKSKVVRMMSHTGHFRTSENAALGVRVLELPYRESKKSMVILLPDESQSLRDLERKLTPQHIVQCLDALTDNGPVSVRLPMFRLSDVVDLKQALPALGVRDAFRKDADFSTLCDSPNSPMVSFARHVAVFHARERSSGRMPSVANAQGTANGSGTLHPSADAEGEKQDEGKDEAKFTVDRPFVFLVMNSEPRAALLYGSVRKILGWK